MKKIVIIYWKQQDLVPEFRGNMKHDYSPEKLSEIIQVIISHNLSVMIRPNMALNGEDILVYIDKGKFAQS